mgnify:CR=1 FL=1
MADSLRGREVRLAARPHGEPTPSDFEVAEVDVPGPGDGELRVRNLFISVDPYMRGRMNDVKSYSPPFRVGEVMTGGAVGEVIESNSSDFVPGDNVLSQLGWREYAVADAARFRRVDETGLPLSAYLGVLGMPGLTAWVGVVDIGSLQEGEAFFVSGAAGAVGGLAGQIARLRGATRVIGSAGSDEKVRHLVEELGFDAAVSYRTSPVAEQLRVAAPEGIDVYFDNVGGEHLEAAIAHLRVHGRVAACGMISLYNATEPPPGPRNMPMIVGKRLAIRGFLVGDHQHRLPDFLQEMGGWLRKGKIHAPETVVEGIENAPGAFIGLLKGENTGKMVVRL